MFSKVFGIGLSGIDAYEVSVEVDVSDGLPAFVMVGVLAAEVEFDILGKYIARLKSFE